MPVLHRDYETQSAASLKSVGARRYAADPTTRVLCIAYAVDDGPIESFIPGSGEPIPQVFFTAQDDPSWFIAAHNDAFESAIDEYVLARDGWPLVPIERHICTMAMARFAGLPGELGKVATLLNLPIQKDRDGARLMLELCRPRKPRPEEDPAQLYWPEITPEKLERLVAYCKNDVAVEREIFHRLPRLPEDEHRLWCLDRKINVRGFRVDLELARAARKLVGAAKAQINTQIQTITNGVVGGFTKLNDMREFVNARGHSMSKANKRSITAVLAHDPDAAVRGVLELRQASSNSAVSKYNVVLAGVFPDERIRGLLNYYGTHTGRWTSSGFNAHNLPREDTNDALAAIAAIRSGDLEQVRAFGPPLEVIARLARGLVIPSLRKLLLAGDFSTIEPRVASWFAGERWKLDTFHKFDETGDPMLDAHRVVGARMRGKPVDPDDDEARQHGKIVHMAFNYGATVRVWREHVPDDPRSDDAIKAQEVNKFRQMHPAQTKFMYDLDRDALQCMRHGRPVWRERHSFELDEGTLILRLPGGRPLFYPRARIVPGKFGKDVIAYHNPAKNHADEMWYGSWLAHLVSATSRDLLVSALHNLDAAGFDIILHVHDEIVAEIDPVNVEQDRERFKACMTQAPTWADGLPFAAKVRVGPRYVKTDEPKANTTPIVIDSAPLAAESEQAHICVHCRLDPPDGSEAPSTYNDAWLHARCRDEFIRARMAEESIAWEAPQLAAAAENPPPLPWNIPGDADDEPPLEQSNGSTHSTNGNGSAQGYPCEENETDHKTAEFIYRDLKDTPYLKVAKYRTKAGKKSFPQYHWENGRWESGKPKGPAIPYHLPELLAAPPGAMVWICEGEKDAETLAALGLISTTNPGGAGKWTPELNKWFSGFAGAYVLEDNDAPGHKHAAQVATALSGIIPDVRVLTFHELPEHGDVTDWTEAGGTLAKLLERAAQAPRFAELECSRASDEEMEALDWLWPGRYALGKIGLLVGLPDEGKGLTLSDIMARITCGMAWPCNEGNAPLGSVLLLTAEDDVNDTITPRLKAAGADLTRVHIIKMIREAGNPRMFSLIHDLPALHRKATEIGDVKMILVDPVTAYLGVQEIDSFRATDVRAVLGPLKEFAAELHLSILGVMHFNKKVDITNVLLRISDSLAFGAAARHVYAVINDPDNNRKLLVKGKNNLAPRDQPTLAFGFEEKEVGTDARLGIPIRAPYIVWHPDPVDITAVEAMQAAAESKSPSARNNARQFLEGLLGAGPVASREVREAAKENGISPRTLRRAKDDLHVEIKPDGPTIDGHHTWRWHIPAQNPLG